MAEIQWLLTAVHSEACKLADAGLNCEAGELLLACFKAAERLLDSDVELSEVCPPCADYDFPLITPLVNVIFGPAEESAECKRLSHYSLVYCGEHCDSTLNSNLTL